MRHFRFYGAAKIGHRGQVAIPTQLRHELGLRAGEQVLFVKPPRERSGFQVSLPAYGLKGQLPSRVRVRRKLPTTNTKSPQRGEVSAKIAALDAARVFSDLDWESKRRIAHFLREETYQKGQVIFQQDAPCQTMFLVVSGLVKGFKVSSSGKQQVYKLFAPGDTFNFAPMLVDGRTAVWTEAVRDTVLYTLSRQDFLPLVQEEPVLCFGVAQHLARALQNMVERIDDLTLRRVIGRLARHLLENAGSIRHVSRQDLAGLLGTVREAVERALRQLREAGAIRTEEGRIVVVDEERLRLFVQ